jgi:hypothetical protein
LSRYSTVHELATILAKRMMRWSPCWLLRRSYYKAAKQTNNYSSFVASCCWLSSSGSSTHQKRPRILTYDTMTSLCLPSPCPRTRTSTRTTTIRTYKSDTKDTNNNNTDKNDNGHQIISYITDVEGDASYLDRYVRQSRVIQFVPVQPRYTTTTDSSLSSLSSSSSLFQGDFCSCAYFPYDHCLDFQQQQNYDDDDDDDDDDDNPKGMLIFGGDIWDKGGSDLYVIRQLLDLKRRYPSRVHFLMGNRDINKMRVCQELGIDNDNTTHTLLPHHDGFYWLRNLHLAKGGNADDESQWIPSRTNAVERLQFILSKTMGSPKAFELRRLELQREKEASITAIAATITAQQQQHGTTSTTTSSVSDDDVVTSYRQSCHPITGEIGNYLANATLALRIGQLFVVHGALPLTSEVLQRAITAEKAQGGGGDEAIKNFWKDLSFAMPWRTTTTLQHDNNNSNQEAPCSTTITTPPSSQEYSSARQAINDWMDALNAFAKQSIEHWKDNVRMSRINHDDVAMITDDNNSNNNTPSEKSIIWATKGGYSSQFPAYQLTQYGMGWMPNGKRNPTVVYSSWSVDGMPTRFFPNKKDQEDRMYVKLVREFFRQSGIKLILAGHQPQGDMPWPIRIQDDDDDDDDDDANLQHDLGWVLCCDTSYSGDTVWINRQDTPKSSWRNNKGRGVGPGFRGDVAVR